MIANGQPLARMVAIATAGQRRPSLSKFQDQQPLEH